MIDLDAIRERHWKEQRLRDESGSFPFNAHVDRGALLQEIDRFRAAVKEDHLLISEMSTAAHHLEVEIDRLREALRQRHYPERGDAHHPGGHGDDWAAK